jgi:hypothetical protein
MSEARLRGRVLRYRKGCAAGREAEVHRVRHPFFGEDQRGICSLPSRPRLSGCTEAVRRLIGLKAKKQSESPMNEHDFEAQLKTVTGTTPAPGDRQIHLRYSLA